MNFSKKLPNKIKCRNNYKLKSRKMQLQSKKVCFDLNFSRFMRSKMSWNDVLVTRQINDLIMTISLRACLDQCIGDSKCEKNCIHRIEITNYCDDCAISEKYFAPNHNAILNIMTTYNDTYNDDCKHSNYEWTEWNSVSKSDKNDFETLIDHRRLYG